MFTKFKVLICNLLLSTVPLMGCGTEVHQPETGQGETGGIPVLALSGEPIISVPKNMATDQIREKVASALGVHPNAIRLISGLQELGLGQDLPSGIEQLNVVVDRTLNELGTALGKLGEDDRRLVIKLSQKDGYVVLEIKVNKGTMRTIATMPGSLNPVGEVMASFISHCKSILREDPRYNRFQEDEFYKRTKELYMALRKMVYPEDCKHELAYFSLDSQLRLSEQNADGEMPSISLIFFLEPHMGDVPGGIGTCAMSPGYGQHMIVPILRFWEFAFKTYVIANPD